MLNGIDNISLEELEEIRNMAIKLKTNILSEFNIQYYNNVSVVSKAKKIYSIIYSNNKNKKTGEMTKIPNTFKNIFELYAYFPDDAKFMNDYKKFHRNASKMADYFQLPEYVIKFRYLLFIQTNRKKLKSKENVQEQDFVKSLNFKK